MKTTSFKSDSIALKAHAPRLVPYYLGHVLIFLGCLAVVLVAIWLVIKGQRLYAHYQSTVQYLAYFENSAAAEIPASELSQSWESSLGLAHSLEGLHEEAQPFLPLARYAGWLPVYGGDLQAAPALLPVAGDLGRAGRLLLGALAPAFEPNPAQPEILPVIVARLAGIEAELAQVEARLQQHQQVISTLDTAPLSPRLAEGVTQLQIYLPHLISGIHLARMLPALLGAESPQTYLILTQNSDELRPSGGYINTAGHITFDQGRIAGFIMQDSYAIDKLSAEYPYPPAPLYQYMAAEYWVLRDASWSPDFPMAAQTAADLYKLGQGVSTDGVIAFDQQALPALIRALEPLKVEEEQVTGNNVIQLMQERWAPEQAQSLDSAWWLQRKSFMVSLAETVRYQFEQNLETVNLPLLLGDLAQALQEKHILISLKEPNLAKILHNRNWDGALRSEQGDYLMVVDANVGFNKASALVERHITYHLALAEDGSGEAHLNLSYQHLAPPQPQETCRPEIRYDPVYEQNMVRCYWNYLQVVVPAGAHLVSGPQTVVAGQHLLRGQPTAGVLDQLALNATRTGWGQLLLLPPGEKVSLDYRYDLPPGVAQQRDGQWRYRLYLQKQAGTTESGVELFVTLPMGAQLLESQPQPVAQTETELTYQFNLTTDQVIQISYTLP